MSDSPMGRETEECPCFQLTQVLGSEREPGKNLPDHICNLTMRRACQAWMNDNALETEIDPVTGKRFSLDSSTRKVRSFAAFPSGGWISPSGVWATADGGPMTSSAAGWPLQIHPARNFVFMIIRQWVEDEKSDKLVRTLQKQPEWQVALEHGAALLDTHWNRKRSRPDGIASARAGATGVAEDDLKVLVWHVQQDLMTLGLPATPGTARALLSRLPGNPLGSAVEGATRGLLVTSFGIGLYDPPAFVEMRSGGLEPLEALRPATQTRKADAALRIDGLSGWTTDTLLRNANRLVVAHKAWWLGVAEEAAVDRRLTAYNPGQPGWVSDREENEDIQAFLKEQITLEEFKGRVERRLKAGRKRGNEPTEEEYEREWDSVYQRYHRERKKEQRSG